MRTSPVLLLLVLCVALVFARTSERDKYSGYSMVRVFANGPEDLRLLQEHGIDIDHYRGEPGSFIELVINQNELEQLRATGIALQVVVDDLDAYYDRRRSPKEQELAASRSILELNGVSGFEYGSMGGFYTYAEVVRELDSMKLQYPNLITEKDSIGVTEQGRTVWAVEISDNPGQNEPDEAVAYYDALHHAREPMSMAVLMYYMYWLLDNYGTDPEATYLVNNRRMLFVPVVNPDGYVHNQTTNPNGGGNWRKNRRNNGGGIYGVDLNRNYGYQWGYDNIGSSPSPSSDTYRGPSAYSEPESRAVRDFTAQHLPSVAFSTHSVAGRYLNPYSYKDTVISYEYYAEFASDFSRNNGYLYGTVYQMLSYNSNGTTRDYLHHDLNCFSWTPEFGGSGFWPNQSEIVPVVQENLLPCKYLSWVGGAFADYQAFRLIGNQYALRGDTLRIAIDVRNKGLTLDAISVNVSLQSLYPQATVVVGSVPFGSMSPRQAASNDVNPFVVAVAVGAQHLDEMKFIATMTQEGIATSVDTFSIVVGFPKVLFQDDGESGIGSWTRGGNQIQWDTTSVMAYLGSTSFADSRYGNVANSTNNSLATTSPIALAGSVNPRLEYFARWSNEAG
ncbi:MAG: zinc carboxypeptidase, partial [Ignavibacteriae bacterium]|nr:zinc carboxypeptidase [Ignavibacteriota bacterium]